MKKTIKKVLRITLCILLFFSTAIITQSINDQKVFANEVSVNHAYLKYVTASGFLGGHEPSYGVDSNSNTMWSTDSTGLWSTTACDDWLQVDLGANYNISRWKVLHCGQADQLYNTRDFKLEYSSDGSSWTVGDEVIGNTQEVTDKTLAVPINARYFRLHVTKKSGDGATYPAVRIGEFELYSDELEPVTVSVVSGDIPIGTNVTLSNLTEGAEIYYTTDGSDPKASGTRIQYTEPITINSATTIKVYAAKQGMQDSKVSTFFYNVIDTTGMNVALNKIITASPSGNPATYAIDGDSNTSWTAADANLNHWVKIDLGGYYDLSSSKIIWKDANKVYKYKIEVSNDDVHYYTAADKTRNTSNEQTQIDSLNNCYQRYVRVWVTGLEQGTVASISEFEVYGTIASILPEVPKVYNTPSGWPRPVIIPLPETTTGVNSPVTSLSGTWKFILQPQGKFWNNEADISYWDDVPVPANLKILGYHITTLEKAAGNNILPTVNVEMPYKKQIDIPADFNGKTTLLRFEGTFTFARVWVNGQLVRTHRGGFTTWDADITDYVTPGQSAWVTVGVTAEPDMLDYPLTRGIVGDVKLIAVPKDYLTRLQVETDLDSQYNNATLKVSTGMLFKDNTNAVVDLKLKDPEGNEVVITPSSIVLNKGENGNIAEGTLDIPVQSPQKWDAEHPNLYTLEASVKVGGVEVQTVQKKVGFRKVELISKEMYVNGKRTKLRGVNFHQLNALKGVASVPEWDRKVLKKLKEANINYIRTAHMPQYEYVYDLCDELGFFVEGENSVFFINQPAGAGDYILNKPGAASNAPTEDSEWHRPIYLDTYAEMLEKDRSHPSIIIWSIANESRWGSNMQAEHDYSKAEDTTRPVKFSFSFFAPTAGAYDIYSEHYVDVPLPQKLFYAVIYDEYAHVNCADTRLFAQNPGLKDYYGVTIKNRWEAMYNSRYIGGAIWQATDYINFKPDKVYSEFNPEWGLVDSWGREKPEYWNVKKAYSPIKIENTPMSNPGSGAVLQIPVTNRFNTSNFNEIDIKWNIGQSSGTITDLDIAPGANGYIPIPARDWKIGDVVNIKFYYKATNKLILKGLIQDDLIDEHNIRIGTQDINFPDSRGKTPVISEDSSSIIVSSSDFSIVFNKVTGLITSGIYKDTEIIVGGPHLNLGVAELSQWALTGLNTSIEENEAVINISGTYGTVGCTFKLKIDGAGLITSTYTVNNPPASYSGGMTKGYSEVGVAYDLISSVDTLKWKKKGLWSAYPEDHIARLVGTAKKIREGGIEQYRVEPQWSWSQDMKNFIYHNSSEIDEDARSTTDFRSGKADFLYASCSIPDSNVQVRAESDGTGQVRAAVNEDGTIRFNINNNWYAGYILDGTSHPMSISSGYTNTVKMRLTDIDNPELEDLARNKTITADSFYGEYKESMAVDGSNGTRWSSNVNGGDHWMQVDLGENYAVEQVRINWEAAYGVDYKIQLSTDNTNWTDVSSIRGSGSGGWKTHNFAATEARYVRIYSTLASSYANVSIWTLNVYGGTTALTDLAKNKTITADSIYSTDFNQSLAVDGNDSSRWSSNTNGGDHWIQVDLGMNYAVEQVRINWEAAYAADYKIQLSTDNTNWTDVSTILGNASQGWKIHNFTPTNARYVRVYSTRASGYPHISIWSLNVYGGEGVQGFSDDFEDGNANGWITNDGTWAVESGEYSGTANTSSQSYALAGDSAWTDYTYEVDVRSKAGDQDVGIAFRAIDENNNY